MLSFLSIIFPSPPFMGEKVRVRGIFLRRKQKGHGPKPAWIAAGLKPFAMTTRKRGALLFIALAPWGECPSP
jgi:hypothetical protein